MNYYILNIIFFLITLLSCFVIQFRPIKFDRIVSGLLLFLFLFLMAFRPISVPDTIPYIEAFNLMDSYQFSIGLGRVNLGANMEIGFANLCKLVSLFSSSYRVLFFIIAFLTVGISTTSIILIASSLFEGNTNQFRILPAFLLFISYYGFLHSSIVLRAGLAISFCLFSYAMVLQKRYFISIIFYLIAFSFHNSILFFLIIYIGYFFLPTFTIRTYQIIALTVMGLYWIRFFDIFQRLLIHSARFLATLLPFFNFFNFYLSGEYLSSSFLKTVMYFISKVVLLTFLGNIIISEKYKRNLNVLLIASIIAGLFGAFTAIFRVLDILFIVTIPALYTANIGITPNENYFFNSKKICTKKSIYFLGIGIISICDFLVYSRIAGFLVYK